MNAERWQRIESILARALETTGTARMRLVLAECGDDVELRRDIESLLAEHERAPDYLETPPLWLSGPEDDAADALPERIGDYRIIRRIGRGGMGQVYLAEREAHDFRQQVALKVIRRGMDTADLLARFRLERQILASLNHAHIARVFDVGATQDGLPYLVMEYVEGVPLLEYCDAKRLGVSDRIRLFQHICAAVQHAHQSLVVHRDIKPGNILITADGVPKLLDFGIAKIIAPLPGDELAQLTRADVRLLTPEYSSPEQIRGEPVTTTCDVFALGVLLYQLLVGRHPLASAETTRPELERRILEQEPPPPSALVDAEAAAARSVSTSLLRRQLLGDLDTVTLKAQRKEPGERYASALSMAEDLERYLAGLPVRARSATLRYRTGKFIARNRIAVAAAAGFVALLVSASAVTLYQSNRLREETARTMRERNKALQVSGFLLEMFGTTGPDQPTGDSVTARQLLDRRAATVGTAYANDDELRAEMMHVLAEGYEKLGLFAGADTLARAALDIRRTLYGELHPDLVASLNLLGWLQHQKSNLPAADTLLRQAITVGRAVFDAPGDARLARALNDLGVVSEARGDYQEATALYRESLDMRRNVLGDQNVGVAITTSNLSVVLYRQGNLNSAAVMAESALVAFRRILGDDHPRTFTVQSNLAAMWAAAGDHARAALVFREILQRRQRLLGPRHPLVGFAMTSLAAELIAERNLAEAESLLQNAIDIQRTATGTTPDQLAASLRIMGDLQRRANRPQQALIFSGEALRLARQIYGDHHRVVAELYHGIAEAYLLMGQPTRAETELRASARISQRALGPSHASTIRVQLRLADVLLQQGQKAQAERQITAIDGWLAASTLPADHPFRKRAQELRAALQ